MTYKSKLLLAISLLAVTSAASADILYDNGPIDGTLGAWTINNDFSAADEFTLTANAIVTGVQFGAWVSPGDALTNLDWAIIDNPAPIGATYGSGIQTPVDSSFLSQNGGFAVDVTSDSFSTGDIMLSAGTYWLLIGNAASTYGDPVYWDINNGPSPVWVSHFGFPTAGDDNSNNYCNGGSCSNSFRIEGRVPEPVTLGLFGLGFAGMAFSRRKQA